MKERIESLLQDDHNAPRHNLKALFEGWRLLTEGDHLINEGIRKINKGREFIDEAILKMLESKRKDD